MSRHSALPTTGVLGGTFDPVHFGHLTIAERAREMLDLGRMLLVPTAVPPHKPRESLSRATDRLAMLRLALHERTGLELCTHEMVEDRVSYTYDTMRDLAQRPKPCRPIFVLGMDALSGLEAWHEWQRLVAEFDLAAIGRPDEADESQRRVPPSLRSRLVPPPGGRSLPEAWRDLDPGRGGRIFVLPIEPIPISSSLVRARAASGGDLSDLVPPAVARYIREARLYQDQEETH